SLRRQHGACGRRGVEWFALQRFLSGRTAFLPNIQWVEGPHEVPRVDSQRRSIGGRAEARASRGAVAASRHAEILKVISGSPMDLQRVFAEIAMSAARVCAFDATIHQVDGDLLRVVAHLGPIPVAGTLPLSRGALTARVVIDRRTLLPLG